MQPVSVYARFRPVSDGVVSNVTIDVDGNTVICTTGAGIKGSDNSKTPSSIRFGFDGVFGPNALQDDIFCRVARPSVDALLYGYNATIFAYGQTGSGKTFTILGGNDKYCQRGITPRTLSLIFERVRDDTTSRTRVAVSYMEVYNEVCYDLIASHNAGSGQLQPVIPMEDSDGELLLRNLSIVPVDTDIDALNLLFSGDTNRVVAETSMNQCSTRSHCIFTIYTDIRQEGAHTVKRSKLHLVDLAGSERLGRTSMSSTLFTEGRNINLSLHFLEQVIVALNQRNTGNRSHIPYRNSIMTNILRDSFGGNCKLSMIATMSLDPLYTEETLSTCRFAQRVSKIENSVSVNEETDPDMLIKRLKAEVAALREELSVLKGAEDDEPDLTSEQVASLYQRVKTYLSFSNNATPFIFGSLKRIHKAFAIMRNIYLEATASDCIRSHSLTTDVTENIEHFSIDQQRLQKPYTTKGSSALNVSVDDNTTVRDNAKMVFELCYPLSPIVVLSDPKQALDLYSKLYESKTAILSPEDKLSLRSLCEKAKALGSLANDSRSKIQIARSKLESVRDVPHKDQQNGELEAILIEVQSNKQMYDEAISNLRDVKDEMNRMKQYADDRRTRFKREFEVWRGECIHLFKLNNLTS